MSVDKMIGFLERFEAFDDVEPRFTDYANDIQGLVGPGSIALLNGCLDYIDDDKCYLEVGTFQGMSLIGAALNHKDVNCYGVDNFFLQLKDNWEKHDPGKQSNQLILEYNLEKFKADNCHVFYNDYRKFLLKREDINSEKAEVYLYDGPHEYQHQVAGLLMAMPLLADHAIVFVDDYNCPAVPKSVKRVLALDNGYIREIKRWVNPYPRFREGLVALEFKR